MNLRPDIVLAVIGTLLLATVLGSVAPDAQAYVNTNAAAGCSTAVVASKAGPLCGRRVTTASGRQARAYLGIPYAESTAGERRWTAPVAKAPWTTTRAAVRYGASCPQPGPAPATPPPVALHDHASHAVKALRSYHTFAPPQDEDCLNLNIWTPATAGPDARLPVMVFIYGGAFIAGSSADPLYDGAYLAANRDVILVSFNYRLGVLGFLTTDTLSGNYGFMDQQLALAWVRDHIGAFGGDPDKVTIFGESSGAMSVGLHVFSAPGSTALFRAGIMQSNFLGLPYKSLTDQARVGDIFQQGLGCRDVPCLRHTAVDTLLQAQEAFTAEMSTVFSGAKYYIPFGPVIDGVLLVRQPVAAAVDGVAAKPILIGTNRNEAVLLVEGRSIAPPAYTAWAASLFGTAFEQVMAAYPASAHAGNGALWARVQTDDFLLCSTRHVAAGSAGRVYAYLFDHQPSFKVWGGGTCRQDGNVCHGDELPFVFHSATGINGRFTAAEEKLSGTIMDYWTNFAAYLDPNGALAPPGEPRWPQFGADARDYLVLDVPAPSVQADPHRATCDFWDGVGYDLTDPWAAQHGR